MFTPTPVRPAERPAERDAERGERLATAALLMPPMLLLTAMLGFVAGSALLGLRDLDGSEPMSVQGGYGWLVWVLVTFGIFLVPAAAGLLLGLRARRSGARRRGMLAALLNGAFLVAVPLLELADLLGR